MCVALTYFKICYAYQQNAVEFKILQNTAFEVQTLTFDHHLNLKLSIKVGFLEFDLSC